MNGDSWKMLWIRHAWRLGAHIVNTTKSIHPTDWSPPSWSGDGMRDWSSFVRLKSNSLNAESYPLLHSER